MPPDDSFWKLGVLRPEQIGLVRLRLRKVAGPCICRGVSVPRAFSIRLLNMHRKGRSTACGIGREVDLDPVSGRSFHSEGFIYYFSSQDDRARL
jgi:hypothetical protein